MSFVVPFFPHAYTTLRGHGSKQSPNVAQSTAVGESSSAVYDVDTAASASASSVAGWLVGRASGRTSTSQVDELMVEGEPPGGGRRRPKPDDGEV